MRIVSTFPRRVRVVENLFVPLDDGTRLAARMWLPEDAETDPVPAVLEYIPYRKRDGTRFYDQGMHMYFAGHGYACLRVDIRGSGDSDGQLGDEYLPREQNDALELIAWIARQSWCTGAVGMMGISWGGFNALQVAVRQPPALRTIITVHSTDDRYATDVHWIGGCLSKDNSDWSATMTAINAMPPDPEIVGERWRDMWRMRLENDRPWLLTWLGHQRRDGYWKHGSVCEDFSRIQVPVYVIGGWADNYSSAALRLIAGLKSPRLGLIGPWGHAYPHDALPGPAIGWLKEALRWWDHWLKGEDTGIMDEPLLRVWMEDWVPPATSYAEKPGRWIGETAWPSPRTIWKAVYPTQFGRLDDARPTESVHRICSPSSVGMAAGEIGRYGTGAEWPVDQREDDGGSLVFVSDPLSQAFEILGFPALEISVSSDKPLALLCARLNDVAPDGRSTRVTYGVLNLAHRDGHEHPEPLTPGRRYLVRLKLDGIAHRFPAGHRIALSLSTVYWPFAWPSPELATITVFTGETRLLLPERPPRSEDAGLRPFDEPEAAPETPHSASECDPALAYEIRRDLLAGRILVTFPRRNRRVVLEDIGQAVASRGSSTYCIADGDPLSAEAVTDYDVTLERRDGVYRHRGTTRLTCTATTFRIQAENEVLENGRPFFRRQWDETIPRDMM